MHVLIYTANGLRNRGAANQVDGTQARVCGVRAPVLSDSRSTYNGATQMSVAPSTSSARLRIH